MSLETLSLDLRLTRASFRLEITQELKLDAVNALFGPSGSGKTSLLRAIAGFEKPERGHIALRNEVWLDRERGVDLPPHRRPIGLMFQDARLFPHLNVEGNLRFAEKRSRGRSLQLSLDEVVAALDLGSLLSRRIGSLSGGERQRVALARTLLTRPQLLLLDEPLSGLDRERKAEILPYLEALPQRFGLPLIYVSHSIDEVARLAQRVLVLAKGKARAYGSAAEVLERVDLQAYTGRFEAGSLLDARVARHDQEWSLTFLEVEGETLIMPLAERIEPGATIRLRVRARDVALATEHPCGISIRNILPVTVSRITPEEGTAFAEVLVSLRNARLRARLTRSAIADLGLEEGSEIFALIKSVSFDRRLF